MRKYVSFILVFLFLMLFWSFNALQVTPLTKYLSLGGAVFAIGFYGILSSKSILKVLICVEILFNGAIINIIAFAKYTDISMARGQVFALFVMAIAAAEVALGLTLIIALYRKRQSILLCDIEQLNG